jgi:hypothetical protein
MSAVLPAPRDIDGIACAAGFVEFHPSGRLETATLARDTTVGSLALPAGTSIGLSEDGALQSIRAPVALTVAGTEYPAGVFLQLDATGRVVRYATIEIKVACPVPIR